MSIGRQSPYSLLKAFVKADSNARMVLPLGHTKDMDPYFFFTQLNSLVEEKQPKCIEITDFTDLSDEEIMLRIPLICSLPAQRLHLNFKESSLQSIHKICYAILSFASNTLNPKPGFQFPIVVCDSEIYDLTLYNAYLLRAGNQAFNLAAIVLVLRDNLTLLGRAAEIPPEIKNRESMTVPLDLTMNIGLFDCLSVLRSLVTEIKPGCIEINDFRLEQETKETLMWTFHSLFSLPVERFHLNFRKAALQNIDMVANGIGALALVYARQNPNYKFPIVMGESKNYDVTNFNTYVLEAGRRVATKVSINIYLAENYNFLDRKMKAFFALEKAIHYSQYDAEKNFCQNRFEAFKQTLSYDVLCDISDQYAGKRYYYKAYSALLFAAKKFSSEQLSKYALLTMCDEAICYHEREAKTNKKNSDSHMHSLTFFKKELKTHQAEIRVQNHSHKV